MNNVVLSSWTLKLPESWDESKPDFKGEVDGFKIGEGDGEGRKIRLPAAIVRFANFIGFHYGCVMPCCDVALSQSERALYRPLALAV